MFPAIKAIQSEIPDIPLFQFNSPEREGAPIIQDTIPLAAELSEMTSELFTDVEPAKPRDTLLYIYTSGTTGFPKAAIITNIRYVINLSFKIKKIKDFFIEGSFKSTF